MGRYQVSTRHGEHIEVDGGNWLVALGLGLDALGMVANIDRLACEVLLGGTVIVSDMRAGERFVVKALPDSPDAPLVEIEDDEVETSRGAEDELIPTDGEDSDEDYDEDYTDDSEEDFTEEFTGTLMPVSADEDELALFATDPSGEYSEHVHVSTSPSEIIILPEEEPDESDTRIGALLLQIDESTTTFDAWKLALEGACQIIGAESGAALRREEDGALRFLFAAGPRAHEVLGRRLPPGRGIAGFCTQRDVGLLITEPSRDPRFFSRMDQTTGYTTTAVLAVPVGNEDEMIGCLELLNAPGGFRLEQLEQLSALAMGLADRLVAAPL